MSSSDAPVIVRVQAQTVLIKVRPLRDYSERMASDPSFTTVLDGAPHWADRRFAIGEVLGESRFVKYIGGSQRWRVRSQWTIRRDTRVLGPSNVTCLGDRVAPAPRRGAGGGAIAVVMCSVVSRGLTIGCRAEGERMRYRAR